MNPRIRVRRRLQTGGIFDPELHEEKLKGLEQKRESVNTLTMVLAGAVAFVAVAIISALAN